MTQPIDPMLALAAVANIAEREVPEDQRTPELAAALEHARQIVPADPQPGTWKLETVRWNAPDETLATGTEQQVKEAAAELFRQAYAQPATPGMDAAGRLFADLFITKPDGTHQGCLNSGPGYDRDEMPAWGDVDW